MPVFSYLARRALNPDSSFSEFSEQWANPTDVFSVLLIRGWAAPSRFGASLQPRINTITISITSHQVACQARTQHHGGGIDDEVDMVREVETSHEGAMRGHCCGIPALLAMLGHRENGTDRRE
ncbi:hypothetical protein CHU98_g6759 [Xylaria longipes]|nr:hypothetical protein CHU98_g6759 [Xylaria longipes]